MKKIASIALSVAILGGGLAAAVPANAATITTKSNSKEVAAHYDKRINSAKEELRITKLQNIGNKTAGNAYDKESRSFYSKALSAELKSENALCHNKGLGEVRSIVQKNKSLEKKIANEINATKTVYTNESRISRSYFQQSNTLDRLGNTFKYQKTTLKKFKGQSFALSYKCSEIIHTKAKSFVDKNVKSLTVKEKTELSSKLSRLKKTAVERKTHHIVTVQNKETRNKVMFTEQQNNKIKNVEKKVKSLQAEKTKALNSLKK